MSKPASNLQRVVAFVRAMGEKYPGKLISLFALTVLVSIFEGLGMGMLVPLIESIGVSGQSGKFGWFKSGIESFGINFTLVTALLLFFGIQVLRSLVQYFQTVAVVYLQNLIMADMRVDLFQRFMKSTWRYALDADSSEQISLLVNETRQVGALFLYLALLATQTFVILSYLAITFALSAKITLAVMVLGVVSFLFLKPIFKRALKHGGSVVKARSELQSAANEHLMNGKLIRSMNLIDWSIETFTKAANSVLDFTYRIGKGQPLVRLLFEPAAVALLCIAIYFAVAVMKIPFSALAVMMLIFIRILPQVSQLQEKMHAAISLLPALDTIAKHTESATAAEVARGNTNIEQLKQQIELKDISFAYSDRPILDRISCKIPANRTVAFIGPSGSGKTTLVDLLVGLLQPTSGDLLIDGTSFNEINMPNFRDRIGYVGQDTQLFNLTLRENMILGRSNISEAEIWESLKLANADAFVKELDNGLDTIVGDHGMRLSGGQRQRIALARALIGKPLVLILDEATSALDYESEAQIQKAINSLDGKLTIVVIAHRLRTIKNADTIYEMAQGKIISQGNYENLGLAAKEHSN